MAGLITLLIVLAIALYVCWLMLQPFFKVILWAAVLAVVFYPMHRRIVSRYGRPTLSAAISTLLVVVFILLPVTFITIAVVRELSGAAASLPTGLSNFSISSLPIVGRIMDWVGQYIHVDPKAAERFVAERVEAWAAVLAGSTLMVVGGAVGRHRADGARRVHAVLSVPRRRADPPGRVRAPADPAGAGTRHRASHARGDRCHRLRRPGDRRDSGNARHDDLRDSRFALTPPLGCRDVLPVDDPDGRRVSRMGACRRISGADRRMGESRWSSSRGDCWSSARSTISSRLDSLGSAHGSTSC